MAPRETPARSHLSIPDTRLFERTGYSSDASTDQTTASDGSSISPSVVDSEEEDARRRATEDYVQKLEAHARNNSNATVAKPRTETDKIIDRAREYQQELFERAKEENIIAVLDTGLGKTLIAAMLIRHVFEEHLVKPDASSTRKHVFFLANSVPLVHQQARVLTSNLPAAVQAITGQDNIDKWDKEEWTKMLQDQEVLVCTAAVLDQALFHNFVRIENLSLVVFDEAHHCKKNHPYSRIIRDYYLKTSKDKPRPRLFGMTASPVDSKRDVMSTITELEELLHSKIVTVPDASLLDFAYKPVDETWEYGHLGHTIQTQLYKALIPLMHALPFVGADLNIALQMSSHLGTWFTDRVLRHVFGDDDGVRGLYGKFERSQSYESLTDDAREDIRKQLFAAPALVRQLSTIVLTPGSPAMSSKVQMLYDKLDQMFRESDSARAMVFVEQRWTAVVLSDAFQALRVPHLHAGFLTGGGTRGNEVVSAVKQEQTMRKFNAGMINILFTTSVGEEGIDIPLCNLVVRFDPNKKTIQYIQSRGRARMKNSTYAHMIEQDNFAQRADMDHFKDSADYLKRVCQQLPPDRLLGKGTKLAQMLAQESSYYSFETSTGATCNFNNCLLILSRYASSLYHIGATASEVYEEIIKQTDEVVNEYSYTVRLPVVGESFIKGAKGKFRPNKVLAKRDAAFHCVVKLRAAQLLDENLDSKFKRLRRLEHRMAVNDKKKAYDMISKPKFWNVDLGVAPAVLYAAAIDIRPRSALTYSIAPMVLLTRQRLPQFPTFLIYLGDGVETDVSITNIGEAFSVDEQQIQQLTSYTLNAVFADVFNKEYSHEPARLAYWLVPKSCAGCDMSNVDAVVDFEQLKPACKDRDTWQPGTDPSKWCKSFLVDPLSGRHHYISDGVVEGKSVLDDEPTEFLPSEGKKRFAARIIEFTDSHWNIAQKKNFEHTWDLNQPVLKGELLALRRNFLGQPTKQEKRGSMCWLAPQPLQLGRISVDAARAVLVWPSIAHRLESYLIVLEGLESIGLMGIPTDLALEAFTKANNIDDQEARTSASKEHGMGKNYERLEFIGDSFLKMTSTISVYNRTTGKEGDMHDRRKNILCNANMFNVSTEKLHLYRYIRNNGFDRATWYPEHLILTKGRGADKQRPVKHEQRTHDLGKKTIADVSEATIGACIMATKHQPMTTRFDLGIKAITVLTDSDDHRINDWTDFAKQHTFQDWQLRTDDPLARRIAEQVGKKVGYTFKHPRLARSALTHPSEIYPPVPDYQRLEFLGDACFDWVAIWWLFDNNPDRDPEWLTEHKMAMVSNQFLSALAVVLGLDTLCSVTTVKLRIAVDTYAREIRQLRADHPDAPDFWRKATKPIPKALADQVEAIIGAMLVDSNFDFAPIEAFFFRHVEPFFRDISLYDGFANRNPTSLIYKTASGQFGCRRFRVEVRLRGTRALVDEDAEAELAEDEKITAAVMIHRKVVGFADGHSARYAKVRASGVALRALEGLSRAEFRELTACYCGERDSDVEAELEEALEESNQR